MVDLWQATLVGTIAGCCGTGLGGLIISLLRTPRNKTLSFILAFSAGIMVAVVFQDLIPESLIYGSLITFLTGFIFGSVFLYLLDVFLPQIQVDTKKSESIKTLRLIRTSILIGIGIAAHNFPEGLAIGAGYAASEKLGIGIALVLAFHDAPEGMAMAAPMKAAGTNSLRIIGACALAGVPTGMGALIGSFFGSISHEFLSIALGFAAGAMLFLVCDELLPIANELDGKYSTPLGLISGIIAGSLILFFI